MVRALLAALVAAPADAITKEFYTTNAVCKQQFCVNPIFPGLHEIPSLETKKWQKHGFEKIQGFLDFCKGVVNYDPALPMDNGTSLLQRRLQQQSDYRRQGAHAMERGLAHVYSPLEGLVRELDGKAAKTYFYHLAGMHIEAWDHQDPLKESTHPLRPCARAVARLACFTHFPKAYAGLSEYTELGYVWPCRNSCTDYIDACGVDCCDEGVSCVWEEDFTKPGIPTAMARKTQDVGGNMVTLRHGYVDADGPCLQCTGSAFVEKSTSSTTSNGFAARPRGATAALALLSAAFALGPAARLWAA